MRIALYQPDIAPNAGTLMRLAACFGIAVDLIEPAGFLLSDARFRRAGMDYLDQLTLVRHVSWEAFQAARTGRLVLLTTRGQTPHHQVEYRVDDVLMVGRESAGVPESVHDAADLRVRVPMRPGLRSINVALAGTLVLGEAMRQTNLWPGETA
jgi:tRNA (cytidine/uridine-2'-O-)-methyltransferase